MFVSDCVCGLWLWLWLCRVSTVFLCYVCTHVCPSGDWPATVMMVMLPSVSAACARVSLCVLWVCAVHVHVLRDVRGCGCVCVYAGLHRAFFGLRCDERHSGCH